MSFREKNRSSKNRFFKEIQIATYLNMKNQNPHSVELKKV